MIIIGQKYKFNEFELKKLKRYNIHYVQTKDEIENLIKTDKFKFLILNINNPNKELIQYLTHLELKGTKFLTIENFLEKYLGKIYIPDDNSSIDYLDEIKPYSKFQYFLKRIIDFSIAIPLALLTSPVMIYAAYRIKKESPDGPIIFKQERVGKAGKIYICYKFRSMKTNSKFFNHYTQENDPRIFPWGKIMRKTRIDELPQLLNVIKGEFHIIGPRAEWAELVKKYEKIWPYYNLRHLNAPGITGWAQVNYPYGKNIEDTRQKLMYDLYYIKNWSLWLEIKTIFKTIWVIIGRKGL